MFKRIAAGLSVLALTAGAGLAVAGSASAAIPFHGPFTHASQGTELSPTLFGTSWVANDFADDSGNNALVSVWDDPGTSRSFFTVRVTSGFPTSVQGVTGTEVVTIRDEHGAYLSDWNNSSPSVDGYRGRFVYSFNNDVASQLASHWLVVPEGNNFALINEASPSSDPLALTVAEGNTNMEAGLPAQWSDTSLLTYTANDVAQEWDGNLTQHHHNLNPNPTVSPTSNGHHHHPGPTPTVTVTSTSTPGAGVLSATEAPSGYVNGGGVMGDQMSNTITVKNTGTTTASVTVSDSAAISGTVTLTNAEEASLGSPTANDCVYTVSGTIPSVAVTNPTQNIAPNTSVPFTTALVVASDWNNGNTTVNSTGPNCAVETAAGLNGLNVSDTSNVNLTVTETPTAVSGTTNIPVTPSSVSEVFTG